MRMPVPVRKTYKLFIGGRFPRTESGRSFAPAATPTVNVARASRKDLRDAVIAARQGLQAWRSAPAYLRGQILYRLAEMLQSRRAALRDELRAGGDSAAVAGREVDLAVELAVWYAGLADKVQALLGSQNAVQGPFFAFSTVEPTGVVGVVAPDRPALAGLLALCLPLLVAGNTVVALCSEAAPCAPLALGEVFGSSDFPAGSVNLLAGLRRELLPQYAQHRDIDGLLLAGPPDASVSAAAAASTKRVRYCDLPPDLWRRARALQSLSWVEPFVEVKTLWHPVAP